MVDLEGAGRLGGLTAFEETGSFRKVLEAAC